MATIEKNALVFVLRPVEQPVQPFHDGVMSRALIQQGANVLWLEATFLQGRADEKSVIYAAIQPIRQVRILINSDNQGTACRRRHKITCNGKAARHRASWGS